MRKRRRIFQKNPPFGKGLPHQGPVADVFHVPHAAVNELCGARRRPRSKVLRVHHEGLQAPACRINGYAQTGCARADHDNIKRPGTSEHLKHPGAVKRLYWLRHERNSFWGMTAPVRYNFFPHRQMNG